MVENAAIRSKSLKKDHPKTIKNHPKTIKGLFSGGLLLDIPLQVVK